MSIEDLLRDHTRALDENTAAMNKLIEMGGSKATGGGSSSSSKSSGSASKGGSSSSSKSSSSKGSTKKQTGDITVETVTDKVGKFLKVGDKDERESRKDFVRKVIEHYDAERFTAIDPDQFAEALGFLEAFENGEDPFDGGGEEEEEEEGGSMI